MQDWLEFATALATDAGALIKQNFSLKMQKEWKEDHTPLTVTDTTINSMVLQRVAENFPEHSVLAEEGSNLLESSEYTWVCDPLDGTFPFGHGIPTCVFSIALVKEGQPLLAVVYDPFMDRMFTAQKGRGAFLNGEPIRVSSTTQLDKAIVGILDWPNSPQDFSKLNSVLRARGVQRINLLSITYMGMLVACGELSASIFPGLKAHDSVTIKLLVEEAGGKVTDLFGQERRYDQDGKGHLAGNSQLHEQLLEIIRETVE